jgi:cytochrome c oxidase cbb3-type subunit 3
MKDLGMEKEEIVKELTIPTWKRFYNWAWSIVPVANEEDIDLGHDYDGIRELDNRLPPWWLVLFYGSIAFAAVYMYIYHWSGSDWSSQQEYIMAMEHGEEMKKAYLAKQADFVDETNVEMVTDDASLAIGKDIFMAQCAVCHGQLGEGLVGPNFTDPYWIHGGGVADLFKTIKYGVPEKGMISWKSQLRPSEMQNVASYILTLQGTNPPNQKAREGELWDSSANDNSDSESGDDTTGALDVDDTKL